MNISVREYRDEDYLSVRRIILDSLHYEKPFIKDDRVLEFVGTVGDVVAGYFNIIVEHDIVKDIWVYYVGYVCVDVGYRGMGLATAMMEFAENLARSRKVSYIELTSGNYRHVAHNLYRKLGYCERNSTIFRKEIL